MSLDFYLIDVTSEECLFDRNITHNVGKIALAVGAYQALWRHDEIGIDFAFEMIPILKKSIEEMKSRKEELEKLNPANGWGSYEGLLRFMEAVLVACLKDPEAKVQVSR